MRPMALGGRIRYGVGLYDWLNKGFEQRVDINRAVPYQFWSNSFMEGTNSCAHQHGFAVSQTSSGCTFQLISATYSMSTTECRRKHSTHGRRTSVRGARWRKAARLVCHALSLKRRSTLKISTTGWHIGYRYQGGGYSIGIKKAGHGFRQGIVFFVYHLPLTRTRPLDAGADDSTVHPLLSDSVEPWRRVTRRIKARSFSRKSVNRPHILCAQTPLL